MRLLRWILSRLEHPHAARWVIAIGLLLSLPALAAPLVADEHLQAVRFREQSLARFVADAFVFVRGDVPALREDLGAWWVPDDLQIAFFRPLSALTHALDLALFPGRSALMHLHTLLWLAALLVSLEVLFRRVLPPRAATLALALYAWDDARGGLLSWVSNRHALVAAVLAVWALVAHDRARREGWRAGPWLAPLLFGLGLLASEMALATAGYLVAYALVIDREGSAGVRLARLWPFALVALGWQLVYSSLGYGVVGSGSYVHPLHEPLAYLGALPQRAVVLALGQLSPIASDFWLFYPPAARVVVVAIAIAVVAAVVRASSSVTRAAPAARAMVIGALLSLLPIAAAAPGDRNLVFVGLGASAWLAVVLDALARAPEPSARLERGVVRGLVVTSFVLGPLFLPLKCLANLNFDAMHAAADAAVPREPGVELERVVVASVPSEGPIFFAWSERDAARVPRPRHTLLLSSGLGAVSIERLAPDTLRVTPEGGFFASDAQTMLRSASRPFHQGEIVQLSEVRVTVAELTDDGRPRVVDFRFTTPIDPTRGLWLRGEGMGLVPWSPPAVGETVVVPAAM